MKSQLETKTCAAAVRRREATARARNKTRLPVPFDWCRPRPLPRRASPTTPFLPETSELKDLFIINDITV